MRAEPRRQRGMALLVVWILVLALVFTLGTVFYRHQLAIARVAQHTQTEQALLLALSVENWAMQMLGPDYDDPAVDHLQENWAQAVPALPVEGGFISGCLIDMQGRFNLNSLAAYDRTRWQQELDAQGAGKGNATTFLTLLEVLGLPGGRALAGMLADWTDPDGEALAIEGSGEQLMYDSGRQRVMVPNAPMVDTAELYLLQGLDVGTVQSLLPFVSALPRETPVNINTASQPLLMALGGDRGPEFTERVLALRPFASLNEFRNQIGQLYELDDEIVRQRWSEQRVSVFSDYFALNLKVGLGSAELEVTSLIERAGQDSPVVLMRTLTRVPSIDRSALDEEELALLADPCTGLTGND